MDKTTVYIILLIVAWGIGIITHAFWRFIHTIGILVVSAALLYLIYGMVVARQKSKY